MFNKPINTFTTASIRKRQVLSDKQYPISFRFDERSALRDVSGLQSDLDDWLRVMDTAVASNGGQVGDPVRGTLVKIQHDLTEHLRAIGALRDAESATFRGLLSSSQSRGRYMLDMPNAHNVVVSMFLY